MKRFVFLLVLSLMSVLGNAQGKDFFKNEIPRLSVDGENEEYKYRLGENEYRLKGKVKSVEEKIFEVRYNTTNIFVYDYNQQGYLIQECSYKNSKNMPASYCYKYIYDSKNNLVESQWLSSNRLLSKKVYNYDQKGRQIEKKDHIAEGTASTKYEYDAQGNRVKEISYGVKGGLMNEQIGKYDKNGRLIELIDETGKKVYKYDSKGYLLESLIYDKQGALKDKHTFVYDEKKNTINAEWYENTDNKMALYRKDFLKYNNEGKITEQIQEYFPEEDESVMKKNLYKYNDKGDVIEKKKGDDEGFSYILTYQYKYDKNGNIISKEEYNDGELYQKKEYVITYY